MAGPSANPPAMRRAGTDRSGPDRGSPVGGPCAIQIAAPAPTGINVPQRDRRNAVCSETTACAAPDRATRSAARRAVMVRMGSPVRVGQSMPLARQAPVKFAASYILVETLEG